MRNSRPFPRGSTLLSNATLWMGNGEVMEKGYVLFDGRICYGVNPARIHTEGDTGR